MPKICCVCSKNGSSYRCPVCRQPYCSIDCCKEHKTSNCQPSDVQQDEVTEDQKVNIKYDFPTEDTVPVAKLNELHHSEELRNHLKNPHVRNIMRTILTEKNPTKAIALAMTEPIFVDLADACLKVVEPRLNDDSY